MAVSESYLFYRKPMSQDRTKMQTVPAGHAKVAESKQGE